MSEDFRAKQSKPDLFRVVLGNTDRSAAEVISHIHRTVPALADAHIAAAQTADDVAGQLALDFSLPPGRLDAAGLQRALNAADGCMFQVESIKKI